MPIAVNSQASLAYGAECLAYQDILLGVAPSRNVLHSWHKTVAIYLAENTYFICILDACMKLIPLGHWSSHSFLCGILLSTLVF